MSPKNFVHSKAGSVGSLEMTFFGILKIRPLELCGNEFQSTGCQRLTVCSGTDSYYYFSAHTWGKTSLKWLTVAMPKIAFHGLREGFK